MPMPELVANLSTIEEVAPVDDFIRLRLISGLTPRRTAEYILIGKVVEEGPEVKDAITRSSSDRVKAKSHPEITAGAMIGSVTRRKVSKGVAPRSSAASSSERLKVTNRDDTTTET